jgi:hypothetical protein
VVQCDTGNLNGGDHRLFRGGGGGAL